MEIVINKQGTTLTVAPKGRMDSVTSGEVESRINEALSEEVTTLRLDMTGVDFISSKAIRVMLVLHNNMAKKGGLVLSGINNSVREVLKMSALLDVFHVE